MKKFVVPAVVTPDPDANTTDLLVDRVAQAPDDALFALPTADGGWSDVTAAEFHTQVIALAKGFIAAGVEPGEKIGFMCKTRYEWTLVDFAAWFAGAVLVPIYETSSPSQIQYILEDSEAHHLIVETAEHYSRFDEIASDVPSIGHVWQMHLGASTSSPLTARTSPTRPSRRAARRQSAVTSRPSSTRRARRECRRASC